MFQGLYPFSFLPYLVYPQYLDMMGYKPVFWDSLIAQLVKNPPAMQETPVRSLGWEDPMEKGKATHSSIPTE